VRVAHRDSDAAFSEVDPDHSLAGRGQRIT
jgi:hypothetical protein